MIIFIFSSVHFAEINKIEEKKKHEWEERKM